MNDMSLPLFFVHTIDTQSSSISLNEESSKHIIQVLRMSAGESLQLTNGKGTIVTASIIDDHKKNCIVQVNTIQQIEAPIKKTSIAISLVKNTSRFEWFLEKVTEIGVASIIPLICARTEKQHVRIDRMKSILTSAMLQSKQTWLPELHEPLSYKECIEKCTISNRFIAHCENNPSKKSILSYPKNSESIILIGPEGDFSSDEIEMAVSNHFIPVSLGETRLRTETAGVVAAVLLQQ